MEYEWRRKYNKKIIYNIKERPQNRNKINELLAQGYSLDQLQKGYYIKDNHKVFLTSGLTKQVRKMYQEGENDQEERK